MILPTTFFKDPILVGARRKKLLSFSVCNKDIPVRQSTRCCREYRNKIQLSILSSEFNEHLTHFRQVVKILSLLRNEILVETQRK